MNSTFDKFLILCMIVGFGGWLGGCGNATTVPNDRQQVQALFPDGEVQQLPSPSRYDWVIRMADGTTYYAYTGRWQPQTNLLFRSLK